MSNYVKDMSASEKLVDSMIGLVLGVPLMLYCAFVMLKFWGWFVIPLGAPEISMAHMIGLTMIGSIYKAKIEKEEDRVGSTYSILYSGILYSWAWLLGYIVSRFM